MGLDQYAHCGEEEIAYWRKHNRLQGWMENLYREKGGTGDFNCVDVELTLEDLDQLEAAINDMDLPETHGFFFGTDSYVDYEEWYKDGDLKFIADARKAINAGKTVTYSSWW